jgi:hypothetical protein
MASQCIFHSTPGVSLSGKPQFGIPKRTSKLLCNHGEPSRARDFLLITQRVLEIAHLLAIIVLRKINMHAPRESREESQIAEGNFFAFFSAEMGNI